MSPRSSPTHRSPTLPTPARRKRRARAGLTLIEVAASVAVLALAIATSVTALQSAFLNLDTTRNLEIAGQIMQVEMEKERLFTWTQLNDSAYTPTIDTAFTRNPAIAGRFSLARTLTVVPNRNNQVVQITLTASWRSYDGRNLTRSYTTYFAQTGINQYFYNH